MNSSDLVRLGQISANIAGDYRYTEIVSVCLDASTGVVFIRVHNVNPIGGMDGPGGVHNPSLSYEAKTKAGASAKDVIMLLRDTIRSHASIVRDYGTPFKKFEFFVSGENRVAHGLSVKNCQMALTRGMSV